MYGRYTQELGVYAKEEAARLRDGGVRDGLRRNTSVRSRAADLLEYEKDPCAKCQSKCRSLSEPETTRPEGQASRSSSTNSTQQSGYLTLGEQERL